ncbi:MAG TPA: ATP-grasp domain-containing protein [Gaiellaceae bacterium]|nr:ATP-grasp domain-containing protein [Gaiellaceae bacterium]
MDERVVVLGSSANRANVELVAAWRELGIEAELVAPTQAAGRMDARTVAVARLDVLPSLDGVEPGLLGLLLLERAGIARMLNTARALLAAHDKRRTARLLAAAGIPHPATVPVRGGEIPSLDPPLVVKPPFGSWGRDVFRCETWQDVTRVLRDVRERTWFHRHGALLQELVPPRGHDLRVLVAAGRVVGAVERISAPGEWRTNVALGGTVRSAEPPAAARELACEAVEALGGDFVGVDLLPRGGDDYVVLELNGAVEFRPEYSLGAGDVYRDIAEALQLLPVRAAVAG